MLLEQVPLLRQIGERLKSAREEAGLGIEHAAATVNASPRLLEDYEAGVQNISVLRLVELAEAYKVSPARLIPGDAEVDYLMDPDLLRFFRQEWGAFDQEEQGFIKEMIRDAPGLLRRRRRDNGVMGDLQEPSHRNSCGGGGSASHKSGCNCLFGAEKR